VKLIEDLPPEEREGVKQVQFNAVENMFMAMNASEQLATLNARLSQR
jgi:hypothetical protein